MRMEKWAWCLVPAIIYRLGLSLGEGQSPRWVVSTTSGFPTEGLQRLAALPDWKLVVVGGEGSTSANWTLAGADFLSFDKQKDLGFKILSHIPNDDLRRKNIGYLWALKNGANVIYDTDDSNVIRGTNITVLDTSTTLPTYATNTSNPLINVYDTYGVANMWPRGFPIANASERAPTTFEREMTRPLIQQGLSNVHPDINAMGRLTHAAALRRGINFSTTAFPLALPRGAMCPLNARSTVFLRDAFWALLLPASVAPRFADVWRGFWAQRLVWEVGGRVAFAGATGERGGPWKTTLAQDFDEDEGSVKDAGRLVKFLIEWKLEGSSLPEAMLALASAMATQRFWTQADVDLMKAWVEDLTAIGYVWPRLTPQAGRAPESNALVDVDVSGNATALILPRRFPRLADVTLIIMYNCEVPIGIPQVIQRMYQPIFGQVLHTGFNASVEYKNASRGLDGLVWVDCLQHGFKQGLYMQECQAKAMHMYPASPDGGYLVAADDTLLDVCALSKLPLDRPWVGGRLGEHAWPKEGYGKLWHYFTAVFGENRTQEDSIVLAAKGLRDSAFVLGYNATEIYGINGTNITRAWGTVTSDVFYIPSRLRTDFIALSMHFVAHHVHTEVITSYVMALLSHGVHENYLELDGNWVWGEDRENVTVWGLSETGLLGRANWVHAVKLSRHVQTVTSWWSALRCP